MARDLFLDVPHALLPCDVVVREEPDRMVTVGFMDPVAVLRLTDNPDIAALAGEVRGKLERVRDRLIGRLTR